MDADLVVPPPPSVPIPCAVMQATNPDLYCRLNQEAPEPEPKEEPKEESGPEDHPLIRIIFETSPRYPCFRQPVLIRAGSFLLAFAENRNVSKCAPAFEDDSPWANEIGSLHMRRSSDGGRSWEPMDEIFVGNIDFYTGVHDAVVNRTYLMLQAQAEVLVFQSQDFGQSWSQASPLSIKMPAPFSRTIRPTVGHGIQLVGNCSQAGRLVLPFVCTNTTSGGGGGDKGACPSCHSCLLLSDNHGDEWHMGAFAQAGTRESQAVQTKLSTSCNLYINERNVGPNPGHRFYSRSSDGGMSIDMTGMDPYLVSPVTPDWTGIVGSISRLNTKSIVYAGAASSATRSRMTLFRSVDEGRSWVGCNDTTNSEQHCGNVLWKGASGYADLHQIQEDVLGILFENGNVTFADQISFATIPGTWLS